VPNEIETPKWDDKRIKILPSGKVSPAIKRNMAAQSANGTILLFLDDDSFPDANLLNVYSEFFFKEENICAGGPGLTPALSIYRQKVSGAMYESLFLGGFPARYRSFRKARFIDDWPSVNLAIRRSNFLEVGGFGSKFWPGEDTIFCRALITNGIKIRYIPSAIVYHHRRKTITAHLIQASGYGLHRGFFARNFPENSRKLGFFLPSLLIFYIIFVSISFISGNSNQITLLPLLMYFSVILVGVIDSLFRHKLFIALSAGFLAVATHLMYGFHFIRGFIFTKNLESKLR
jgi:GT2 family glycosyltransferase